MLVKTAFPVSGIYGLCGFKYFCMLKGTADVLLQKAAVPGAFTYRVVEGVPHSMPSGASNAAHRVLRPITNLTLCEETLPQSCVSGKASVVLPPLPCGLFATLPVEIVQVIVARLADDTVSLRNLCLTSQSFASLFR